jgi:pimeloyl-ACP methyl ester carboxylesterase
MVGTPDADSRGLVVPLVAGAGQQPLVMLHPLGGALFAYEPLLRLLPPAVPVWGVRSPSAAGAGEEPRDVVSMARSYAAELSERLPARPIALFGWSLGGLIALAVAAELEERGFQIEFVEIWDVGVGAEDPLGDREAPSRSTPRSLTWCRRAPSLTAACWQPSWTGRARWALRPTWRRSSATSR